MKNIKKQHIKKNGPTPNNKGPKHDKEAHRNEKTTQHNDKSNKNKGTNIDKHCKFCDHDGHTKSKCSKNMESLEATIKKHNTHLDTSSTSSLGQTLCITIYAPSRLGYALNVSSSYPSQECLIDSWPSYHMGKDKSVFSTLDNCNTINIDVGDDRSFSVVGSRKVHLNNG